MNAGDTFKYGYGVHLWVVLSDPALDSENVLLVNLTSNKSWQDQSCVLQPGEHPFITIETVIFYQRSKLARDADLEQLLSRGEIALREPLSLEVLEKIRKGAEISDRLAFGHKAVLQQQGLI